MNNSIYNERQWAYDEFGTIDFGDSRCVNHLLNVALAIAMNPAGTLPPTFTEWAKLKGAYRLLNNKKVVFEKVQEPHWKQTLENCSKDREYVIIEDTTVLSFNSHTNTKGLGRTGSDSGRGLFLHSSLTICIEEWANEMEAQVNICGLFNQQCWVRSEEMQKKSETSWERLDLSWLIFETDKSVLRQLQYG